MVPLFRSSNKLERLTSHDAVCLAPATDGKDVGGQFLMQSFGGHQGLAGKIDHEVRSTPRVKIEKLGRYLRRPSMSSRRGSTTMVPPEAANFEQQEQQKQQEKEENFTKLVVPDQKKMKKSGRRNSMLKIALRSIKPRTMSKGEFIEQVGPENVLTPIVA